MPFRTIVLPSGKKGKIFIKERSDITITGGKKEVQDRLDNTNRFIENAKGEIKTISNSPFTLSKFEKTKLRTRVGDLVALLEEKNMLQKELKK